MPLSLTLMIGAFAPDFPGAALRAGLDFSARIRLDFVVLAIEAPLLRGHFACWVHAPRSGSLSDDDVAPRQFRSTLTDGWLTVHDCQVRFRAETASRQVQSLMRPRHSDCPRIS